MSYNIVDVIKDELTGNARECSPEVYGERLEICKKCPHLKVNLIGARCGVCGCFVRLKTKYKQSQCPDDPPRWFADVSK